MAIIKKTAALFAAILFVVSSVSVFAQDIGVAAVNKLENSVILRVGYPYAFVDCVRTSIDADNEAVVPVISNDRTFVPLRFVAESLDAKVDWKEDKRIAVAAIGENVIEIGVENDFYTVNGIRKELDASAFLSQDRVFIPLRTVSESLGEKVFWDESGLIIISDRLEIFDSVKEKEIIKMLCELF